jgi:hypothetical protein
VAEATLTKDWASRSSCERMAENFNQRWHQRDIALVTRRDLPAELCLVADVKPASLQIEIVGQKQMTQFSRPQAREQQGQK